MIIYVDIDGTLTEGLISQIKEDKRLGNNQYVLWSSRGTDYARNVAEKNGITDLFIAIIGKPNCVIDDNGLQWLKFTKVVHPKKAGILFSI